MTAQAVNESLDFEIPEELPERGLRSVYDIVVATAGFPPSKLQDRRQGTPRINAHIALQPVSFRLESDMTIFDDNLEHLWLAMFDKNGDLVQPDSNFGIVKDAFSKAGFTIRNKADLEKLVGTRWYFENRRIKRTFKKADPNNPGETIEEESTNYLLVPVTPCPEYVHSGPLKTVNRPRKAAVAASSAMSADNAAEALPRLMQVLEGKTESEYMTAMVASKDETIVRAPYIVEATSNPAALTTRMLEAGMRQIDGKLVN